ncbi:MAG: nitroreductase [Thermoplasmata archaeon]|nr:MAG: nitroreductase [Thermoplasmata archaeon]
MELYDVIRLRKSIRSYDNSKSVEEEKIRYILECAQRAPSWMNKQCWHFIVITDREKILEVAKTDIINRWIKQAPVIIVGCADPHLSGSREGIDYYIVDTAIAMEHLILAATDVGLGTCWIGAFNENKIKELLEIPPRIRIVALTPVGYPKEETLSAKSRKLIVRSTKRRSLKEIIHWEKW